MSSSEAQKSPVHHATEDSTAEPTNETTRPGASGGNPGAGAAGAPRDTGRNATDRRPSPDNDPDVDVVNGSAVIGGGPGAGDSNSGGGAGAGIPGGGTDMRTDGAFSGGNVEEDRKKLFPEATTHAGASNAGPGSVSRDRGETSPSNDPDESSYGGRLNLDDRDAT